MSTAPIEFPPPVDSEKEFVGAPTDPEDERIEVGVAIVGGGPAGLACAIRLSQLLAEDEALAESLGEVPVALVEKGKGPGSHLLSGAMMNPSAMKKLFPDLRRGRLADVRHRSRRTRSTCCPNRKRAIPLKPTPPPFRNHGNHVTSVAQLGRWLSEQAEDAGVYILGETAAAKLLVEDGQVRGRAQRRQGPRPRRRAALELRARLRPDRQGDRARRGHPGPPHRRRDPPLRPRAPTTPAVGARREGGLGGASSRSTG